MLYHPNSDHSRIVEEFIVNYKRIIGKDMEVLSLETRDGSATAALYDITSYPAVIALKDDGQLLKHWQGNGLPLMSEVAAYTD